MNSFRLNTSRLILRDYVSADWERVHIYGADPDFSRFELWGPNSPDDTKKFVSDVVFQAAEKERYKFDLAICLADSELLIGGCGIRRESQTSAIANLGWAITPEFQGKGYATETARKLIEYGFEELRLQIIYATCDTRNIASFKIMEKIGMRRAGYLIGDKMQKGHLRDSYRYELIRNEYDSAHAR